MKWLVSLLPPAVDDITHARDRYGKISPELAEAFLDEVAWAMEGIRCAPELLRVYFRAFRRKLLRRFPYKIFYQIIGDRVVVFRVLHGRQDHRVDMSARPT